MAGKEFSKNTYVEESVFSADDTVQGLIIDNKAYSITKLTNEVLAGREY